MLSSFVTLFVVLLQLGHVAAGSWTDNYHLNGTKTYNNETAPITSTTSTSSIAIASPTRPPHRFFQVRITRAGRRYQTGKRYWGFSGEDAVVTDNVKDAAWFYYENGYLMCEDKYVTVDGGSGYSVLELSSRVPDTEHTISKDKYGSLDLTGDDFSFGKGHGVFCSSDDGNVFVIASKRPPFRCYEIALRSKEPRPAPQGPNSHPAPPAQGPSGNKPPLIKPIGDSPSSPNKPQNPSQPQGPGNGRPQPPTPNRPTSPDTQGPPTRDRPSRPDSQGPPAPNHPSRPDGSRPSTPNSPSRPNGPSRPDHPSRPNTPGQQAPSPTPVGGKHPWADHQGPTPTTPSAPGGGKGPSGTPTSGPEPGRDHGSEPWTDHDGGDDDDNNNPPKPDPSSDPEPEEDPTKGMGYYWGDTA